jgi:hypothetical protein
VPRLSQLASAHEKLHIGHSKHALLDGILIEKCHTIDDILDSVTNKLPDMCREDNISFLCIDSIGGLARTEFDLSHKEQIFERTSTLFKLSQKLKWLSDTFGVCVVVVNQVYHIIHHIIHTYMLMITYTYDDFVMYVVLLTLPV